MPFQEIAGHRLTLRLLARAVARRSLPPSLLFGGPRGVGKSRTAMALAQALNCLSPRTDVPIEGVAGTPGTSLAMDACGVCTACRRIARGIHPDVRTLAPDPETGTIKVDAVRDLIEGTGYRPFEGRWRVSVIDDADTLLEAAQNALLKTLEEPPSTSVFVLVTSRPDVLLPTVRSRCQKLRFGRLPASEIAAVLIAKHDYSAADAHAAAAAADGSIGVALEGGSDEFVEAREAAADLLQGIANHSDPRRRLDGAKVLAGSGDRDDLRRRLRALASMLRDLAAIGARVDDTGLANADLGDILRRLTGSF